MKLARRVGEALPAVVRGEMSMLEQMRPDGILDDFYQNGLGFSAYNKYLSRMVKQLSHRFPRLNILEIGKSLIDPILDTKTNDNARCRYRWSNQGNS